MKPICYWTGLIIELVVHRSTAYGAKWKIPIGILFPASNLDWRHLYLTWRAMHLDRCLVFAVVILSTYPAAGAAEVSLGPFESNASLVPETRIDELVFSCLKELRIQPANVCSDGVFLRPVYLDVIGTLPTSPGST